MSGGEDGRTSGWLFLYARGRKRGYRILLAPDFLIEQEEHGWLGEQVGRATNPPAGFGELTTPSGVPLLALVRRENPTPADLGLTDDPSDRGKTLDEFGRVLSFSYGLVCRPGRVPTVTEAALRRARDLVLEVYRDFLDGEEAFRTRPSTALGLSATAPGAVTPATGAAARTPTAEVAAPAPVPPPAPGTGARGPAAGVPGAPRPSYRGLITVIAAIVLMIAAAGILLWSLRQPPEPRVPAACAEVAEVRVTATHDIPCPTPSITGPSRR
ncbi:hypothetical protein [Streptosporangium sp. NBC_01469]|uniref:hypothetical protein n=1 Tax=Streptosporangium sp. NBC_01469 TaxID=2903898 RepID=UPI002E27F618|nr:hypothetical protein [Streptosporangium sp. NBC_01469]